MAITRTSGFTIIEVVVVVTVVILLLATGVLLWQRPEVRQSLPFAVEPKLTSWEFRDDTWQASGTPPDCESPLAIASPTDLSKINARLMPGQMRGTDFKPHGGLAADPSTNNLIKVSTIRDGYVYRVAQYKAFDQVQYMLDIVDGCGILVRYDHLASLTPEFQAIMDKLPEPQPDDSRTHAVSAQPWFAQGTLIATEIGIRADKNAFFDLGVYDLRQPNAASKTAIYQTDQLRISDKEQSFYSLCWFDLLPEPDRSLAQALPDRSGGDSGIRDSDYCNET